DNLCVAAHQACVPLRALANGTHRITTRGRRQRERCDEGELLPEQGRLVALELDLEPCAAHVCRDVVTAPTRPEDDTCAALVADGPSLDTLGLDAERAREHLLVAAAQRREVVDAVQEGYDDRRADALRRHELEGRLELRRFHRHPEGIDLAIERRRGGDADL